MTYHSHTEVSGELWEFLDKQRHALLHQRITAKDDVQQVTWNYFLDARAYNIVMAWLDSTLSENGAKAHSSAYCVS